MIIEGDGRLGAKEYAPYDCIHVGAAAPELPQALLDQLKKGGRMLIPVGTDSQVFQVIDKDMNGNLIVDNLLGVRYVPLTSRDKQWK
jgi:protein-L-isoaspartate(D-aspartate) O-methyltransferase